MSLLSSNPTIDSPSRSLLCTLQMLCRVVLQHPETVSLFICTSLPHSGLFRFFQHASHPTTTTISTTTHVIPKSFSSDIPQISFLAPFRPLSKGHFPRGHSIQNLTSFTCKLYNFTKDFLQKSLVKGERLNDPETRGAIDNFNPLS